MRRGDVAVLSISSVLAVIVVAAVSYSLLVLDRLPSSAAFGSEDRTSTWLVVTWAPSLCTVEPGNPGCASGHVGAMGHTWILHGLWPQGSDNLYCGVPKDIADRARNIHGSDMPAVDMRQDVRDNLDPIMSDAMVLAPHEWYTHGTCSGVTPDVYFSDAAALTDQARTILDPLFADAEGTRITLTTVRYRFDEQFGQGAGERVGFSCRNVTGHGSVIYEARLSLPPVPDLRGSGETQSGSEALPLKELLVKAPAVDEGCRHAHVP